jgi:hypothetical protein
MGTEKYSVTIKNRVNLIFAENEKMSGIFNLQCSLYLSM